MELKNPKPKKRAPLERESISPSKIKKKITGVFNGQSVVVSDLESINLLYGVGNFGKGTLSRGQPSHRITIDDIPRIYLQHQFKNHSRWNAESAISSPSPIRVQPNRQFDLSLQSLSNLLEHSFSDGEEQSWKSLKRNYFTEGNKGKKRQKMLCPTVLTPQTDDDDSYRDENFTGLVNGILESKGLYLKPEVKQPEAEEVIVLNCSFEASDKPSSLSRATPTLKIWRTPAEENLNLNLEESFFLKSELGWLKIIDLNSSELDINELWEKFNAIERNFTQRYVTYHYYRAKGWVVKSGLKFGGTFLLYKDGPAHHHSSYLVKVLDEKKVTWREFVMANRLVETFNKDLIVCNISPGKTSGEGGSFPEAFLKNSIQQVLVKRWFPTKERFSKEGEPSSGQ